MALDSDLADRKVRTLKDVFGYDGFRPGQERVIDSLLTGRHVLAVMPTGAGKSMCFQIPALVRGGLTIVVSPLVALMQDQVAALRLAGVAADTINSSRSHEENQAVWRRVAGGETALLYLAPERLMTERMLTALSELPVRLIAIDEAHCISQWGPAFRPEYEQLSALRVHFPEVPIAALTATADELTRSDILQKLFEGDADAFVSGFDRPNIQLTVERKTKADDQLLRFLEGHRDECGIVYCLSRRKTDDTAAFLNANGVRALTYHAGMDKETRTRNQEIFLTESGIVMVATIAFGMGIDKPDVRFVFHTDIPGSLEAYYQEIGRAGRDGAPSRAVMLYGAGDIAMRRRFIEDEDCDEERRRLQHKRLDALISYCEAPECRRRTLLAYFGERIEPCGNCDACTNPVGLTDGTIEGQKALSAILRTGQRFGAVHIIDVLRGARTDKIAANGHDRLPTYGVGSDHSKEQWRSILRQLDAAGYIGVDMKAYGALKVTDRGRELLRGDVSFRYRQDVTRGKRSKERSAARGKGREAERPALSTEDQGLLNRLKAVRTALARERGVPAYVIFADKSLEDMAVQKPQSRDDFAGIHGVGQVKLQEFAAPFLDVLCGDGTD